MAPQLLIAGHIVKDVTPQGWHPGGGALYAAAQAAKLHIDTVVVTVCDADIEPERLVPDVEWHIRRQPKGIEFENTYSDGRRTQRVLSTGAAIRFEDIPSEWREPHMALLTPVFHDVAEDLPDRLVKTGAIVGVAAQGWLRRLEGDRVRPGEIEAAPGWLRGTTVFLSEEDALSVENAARWRDHVRVVVLTRGRKGCTVWDEDGRHDLPPVPSDEREPTGAGDVFATAFMVRYGEGGSAIDAARFGAAAAAIAIEGQGTEAIGGREKIEARLAATGVMR